MGCDSQFDRSCCFTSIMGPHQPTCPTLKKEKTLPDPAFQATEDIKKAVMKAADDIKKIVLGLFEDPEKDLEPQTTFPEKHQLWVEDNFAVGTILVITITYKSQNPRQIVAVKTRMNWKLAGGEGTWTWTKLYRNAWQMDVENKPFEGIENVEIEELIDSTVLEKKFVMP